MTFVPAVNCAEAVIHGIISSKPCANVLNFIKAGGYDQTDISNLADTVDTWVGSDYLPLVANSVDYVETHVRGLTSLIDLEATSNLSAGVGTLAGTAMPANATLCMTLRTGHTGRSARGRFYAFPFASSVLATSQTVTSAYSINLAAALSSLVASTAVAGWTMVVLSKFTLGAPRLTALATVVTNIDARNTDVDSQRGRLIKGH